ncbi:hypothetical protein [Lysobacter sp. CA199]|uniref:hypothetical protein n=1 Tax=Lysobacter sp. CA199 TaxID=3455608 RepID=UPI003F8D684C
MAAPAALRQIAHVVALVVCEGADRSDATRRVAAHHRVARETVADKYGRQLGLTTQQFDAVLKERDLGELRNLLTLKFPGHDVAITAVIQAIQASRYERKSDES